MVQIIVDRLGAAKIRTAKYQMAENWDIICTSENKVLILYWLTTLFILISGLLYDHPHPLLAGLPIKSLVARQ